MRNVKFLVIAFAVIVSAVLFWRFLNASSQRTKAAAGTVNISFSPKVGTVVTNTPTVIDVLFQPTNSSYDITSFDVTFVADGQLSIEAVDATTGVVATDGTPPPYTEIKKEISAQRARVAYVSLKSGSTPGNVRALTMKVTVKATATGAGNLSIESSSFKMAGSLVPGFAYAAGSVDTGAFTISDQAGQPTNTPIPGQPTATPAPTDTPAPGQPTNTPAPTATPVASQPTGTPTPTPTAAPGSVNLNLKLQFQGIAQGKIPVLIVPVKVTIAGGSLSAPVEKVVDFTLGANGVWSGTLMNSGLSAGSAYSISVKGPKHLKKKICDAVPTETGPGSYRCTTPNISLVEGYNDFDFTKVTQPVGDLPEQNGIINSGDLSLVRLNLSSTDPAIIRVADLNYDGVVNTQDFSLMIESLEVRPDE